MKNFKSTGFVLGNLWSGGKGFYPAEKLEDKTKRGLFPFLKKLTNKH